MLLNPLICLGPFWLLLRPVGSAPFNTGEIIEVHEPSYCAIDEYFNVNQMKCITCDSDSNLIPSSDGESTTIILLRQVDCSTEMLRHFYKFTGMSCVCNERSKIKRWNFASFPVCEPCKEDEIPTKDHMDCIPCSRGGKNETVSCESFQCSPNTVFGEYYDNIPVHAYQTIDSNNNIFLISFLPDL